MSGPDSTTGGVDHLLSEAGDGPWWPEPPREDEPSGVPSFWLTNEAGDSLHFDANDVAALLAEVRRLRAIEEAARPLVAAWNSDGCDQCGGTGVAWDWPDAVALRDAVFQSEAAPTTLLLALPVER